MSRNTLNIDNKSRMTEFRQPTIYMKLVFDAIIFMLFDTCAIPTNDNKNHDETTTLLYM